MTYKPFMYIRDVPSIGTSSTVMSRTTGRVHHYLSRQEFKVHLLAEYSESVIDIREQFPLLPWDETQLIANKLGIKYPKYPGTTTPLVLTTDLVLTMKRPDGEELIAISVKLSKDLKPRSLEKLLIERLYWNQRGIRWVLATEQNIPHVRVENLRFFEIALNGGAADKCEISPLYFSCEFEKNHSPRLSFNEIMEKTCRELDVNIQIGHLLLGTAVWEHNSRINIDTAPLKHRSPVLLYS